MVRWIVLAVLVIAVTATATVVVQTVPVDTSVGSTPFPVADKNGPRPKAVVDGDMTYHFGQKAQQTTFEKDWVIRNAGDADLKLTLEAPPCSCTVAGFQTDQGNLNGTTKTVPPGGQTKIHFTWQTRENNGKYEKPATILTNDPEHERLEFAAVGEVYPAIVVYPMARVDFGEISTDQEERQAMVYLFSRDKPDFKISKLSISQPKYFSVEQQPMTTEECKELKIDKGIKVTVSAKPGLPLAPFLEELVVESDHPKLPELKMTVTGTLRGPISVLPERVGIFGISGSKGGKKEITLLVRGHRPTQFEVERHPEKLKVEVTPGDNSSKSGKYRLIVTVPPGTPAGTFDDLIILKTDHPQAKELRIPVHGFVRDDDAS